MSAFEIVVTGLAFALVPAIFFGIVIPGMRLSIWAGEKFGKGWDMSWVGWVVYMTGCFWAIGFAVAACVGYVLFLRSLVA